MNRVDLNKVRFHFIGIGGIGMCGLAELLHSMGAKVTGSDNAENANTERLKNLGVKIAKGHRAENIGDAEVVVYSSAVPFTNPEVVQARGLGIPLIPRAEALAEIMRLKKGLAVAGTHGKTTTTSMVSSILLYAKMNPTIFIGGRLNQINSTAMLGSGEWLVAEADESDGSFHKLSPEIAIITNVDSDHLDHYKSFENLQKSFYEFALRIPFYGRLIVCGDDARTREMFAHFPKRILFYGFSDHNDLIVQGENGQYDVLENKDGKKTKIGSFKIGVPGRHNALNALAAFAASRTAGVSVQDALKGLETYSGVDRRFQFKGEKNGVSVYDDYGHHPTEVQATLQAFKEKYPDRRLVVYFQPHRYTRTQHCWHEFTTCFAQADQLLLTDIYPAGETPIEGVNTENLVKEIKNKSVEYLPQGEGLLRNIQSRLKAGDVFVTLGAGDGWKLGMELLK